MLQTIVKGSKKSETRVRLVTLLGLAGSGDAE